MSNDYNELVKEVRPTRTPNVRKGLFLRLEDFKAIEKFYEEVRTDELNDEERKTLWKIKTIIHNIESARLR